MDKLRLEPYKGVFFDSLTETGDLLPFTFYLLPSTFYLLPFTSYLSPFTFYLLPLTFYLLPIDHFVEVGWVFFCVLGYGYLNFAEIFDD